MNFTWAFGTQDQVWIANLSTKGHLSQRGSVTRVYPFRNRCISWVRVGHQSLASRKFILFRVAAKGTGQSRLGILYQPHGFLFILDAAGTCD